MYCKIRFGVGRSSRMCVDKLPRFGTDSQSIRLLQRGIDRQCNCKNEDELVPVIPILGKDSTAEMHVIAQRCNAHMTASCSFAGTVAKPTYPCRCPLKLSRQPPGVICELGTATLCGNAFNGNGRRSFAVQAVESAAYGTDLSFPTEGYLVLVSTTFSTLFVAQSSLLVGNAPSYAPWHTRSTI